MREFSNTIRTELNSLIKESENKIFHSERDPLIHQVIIDKYFNFASDDDKIKFKQAIKDLIYDYQNLINEKSLAVLYYLLSICQTVKISNIDNTLIDVLKLGNLDGKKYNAKDLNLFLLKVLTDLPSSYRTEKELLFLLNNSNYKGKIAYSLHGLEFFSRKEHPDGIILCLNNLMDLNVSGDEIGMIVYRLADSFRVVNPQIIYNWYYSHLQNPAMINGNQLNEALIKFVSFAKKKQTSYCGKKWIEVLNLIQAFSYIYGYLSYSEETTEAMLWDVISRFEINVNRVVNLIKIACSTLNVKRDKEEFKTAQQTMPTMANSLLMVAEVELRGEMPDDIAKLYNL